MKCYLFRLQLLLLLLLLLLLFVWVTYGLENINYFHLLIRSITVVNYKLPVRQLGQQQNQRR